MFVMSASLDKGIWW